MMTVYKHYNKWRFRTTIQGKRQWHSFNTFEEAERHYLRVIQKKTPVENLEIIEIKETTDTNALWDFVEENQKPMRQTIARIRLPNKPFAMVFLSDLHIGSAGVDYRQARLDAETIRDTPNMYAVFHGDGIDNWIIPKLSPLQRGQLIPFDKEIALFKAWLCTLNTKLVAVVAGNHDNWTTRMSGIDWLEGVIAPQALYDPQQIMFDLEFGNHMLRVCVRHKWRGSSIHNPTHGLERASKDIDADIYVGGHTHIGTLFRSFVVRNKPRIAVLTGTYKLNDPYTKELNLPESSHHGAGAVVFDTNGAMTWVADVQEAAKYVQFKNKNV